jgi:putative membrane protein
MRPFILISAAALALAGTAYAKDDDKARDFLKSAMQGDNSEVMLGKLAVAQAGDQATKRFGQMLVDDHSMHLPKVKKVAASMNVAEDSQPMAEAEKERDKLMGLHGSDFDKEFAKYMVKDHRKDISEYQKASRMTGPVGQLARQTLPTLQKHLKAAEQLGG